jgi:hypothetical protein
MDEERIPNQSANRDPAEGARDAVDAGNEGDREAPDHFKGGDPQRAEPDENAGGITNRPLDEEIANQQELPLRGDVKVSGRDHA